ncbi:MAG: ABC transporter ATP-binding protein [Bacilli bacterium]|nr:ABC transporter ATP-binding protein [Bacilli bacterium]
MDNVIVRLENITKKFDDKTILKNISLDIYEGEFITFLGPSGCGKTTLLRIISGLEEATEGKVYIEGEDVTNEIPAKRKVNTIFQNFALFPHMTVWDNINFGLKMHKVPEDEATKRIKRAIKLVQLDGFENRYPAQLSGGQQQRVAIARGIVMNHKVLLLDESLCSLDLKLKREMQGELKKLQKKLGITFIYVTHDQDEALTMSDRIVIINKGNIEQLDTPKEIYSKPKTAFAADFIGESNIIKTEITHINDDIAYIKLTDDVELAVPNNNYKKGKVTLIVRPENFNPHKNPVKESFEGVVKNYMYDGAVVKLEVEVGDKLIKVHLYDNDVFEEGEVINIDIDKNKVIIIGDKNEAEA